MILVQTTDPTANIEGDTIAVSFTSNDTTVSIAMSLNQAFALQRQLKQETLHLMRETQRRAVPACAQIIPFQKRRA